MLKAATVHCQTAGQ